MLSSHGQTTVCESRATLSENKPTTIQTIIPVPTRVVVLQLNFLKIQVACLSFPTELGKTKRNPHTRTSSSGVGKSYFAAKRMWADASKARQLLELKQQLPRNDAATAKLVDLLARANANANANIVQWQHLYLCMQWWWCDEERMPNPILMEMPNHWQTRQTNATPPLFVSPKQKTKTQSTKSTKSIRIFAFDKSLFGKVPQLYNYRRHTNMIF